MVSTVTVQHAWLQERLWVAKKLWQKSAIPATVTNVEMANALVLLQSDSQDHGTADYALCPHYIL